MHPSELDRPDVVAEVRAAFDAYERALLANDVDQLDEWFWADERVVRYGIAEEQYGAAEVRAWRRSTPGVPSDRRVVKVSIVAFGTDLAAVDCEFVNGDDVAIGRQSQTWMRGPGGWRIARAHVSMRAPG